MKRKLLAVMPQSTNYIPSYEVTVARSFEEAVRLIIAAEEAGAPFDDLDLPVQDERMYREFLEWMRRTERNYSFSVFGCRNTLHFWQLCREARAQGFRFNT